MAEVEGSQKQKSNVPLIIISVLLLVLLGVMTWMWSAKKGELSKCEQMNSELNADITEMNEMMSGVVGVDMTNDLRADFQNMLDTYDALIKKDASKSDSLTVQKVKIQGLLDELNNNKKKSAQDIARLRRENETLRQIMIGYVKQIDELNTLNLKLESDLDETTNKLTTAESEREQFRQESEANAEQVRKGSKLSAYGISSTGLRMKLNNTVEPTTKAKSTVQIRSSFTIGENAIAAPGAKTVYLSVTDPEGRVMQRSSGSVVQTDSGAVPYSDKKEINYQNKAVDVSIFYNLDGAEPSKGTYKVRLYCDGQLIGTDSFTLK
jgi:hypothetical protein